MASRSRQLRSGFTTGACAAAAAKASTIVLLRGLSGTKRPSLAKVEIPFPDGSRRTFSIQRSAYRMENGVQIAEASVVKDAGDDPDITNGAEIVAEARLLPLPHPFSTRGEGRGEGGVLCPVLIKGGKGVGLVTRPGLAVPVGHPAINPIPRRMITESVHEGIQEGLDSSPLPPRPSLSLEVTISVPDGERLAKKTLNARLGIVGGISILGTTGIVRPLSTEAWTATITATMDVAKAMGHREIVLSTGRSSEKAHMDACRFPEEVYVMMGDYVEYALREAGKHGFERVHLSAQWAKMLKIALATPQTHVRHGAIDLGQVLEFLRSLGGNKLPASVNTAREILEHISSGSAASRDALFAGVCDAARRYAESLTGGVPVIPHLVSYDGKIAAYWK